MFCMSTILWACKCLPSSIADRYNNSSFIGEFKVLKIHTKDMDEEGYVLVDVQTTKAYKGLPIMKLRMAYENSCRTNLSIGDVYLAYLNRASNGEYYMSSCTRKFVPALYTNYFL